MRLIPFTKELENQVLSTPKPVSLFIESLDLDAQGIAHREDGKVVFIEGALPFEEVTVNVHRKKNNWEQGTLQTLLKESSQRVKPPCDYFGLHSGACGGCKMQHLNPAAQVAVKQRVLEDNLWHLGKVKPDFILRPVQGQDWGYRYRARLSVRYVKKKAKVLIGFHERKSSFVADMSFCQVLPYNVSQLLLPLRELIENLDSKESCPQIELACTSTVTGFVLRHMHSLSDRDLQLLRDFSANHDVQWWLQSKGPDSVKPLDCQNNESDLRKLSYDLPDFGLRMYFRPTDFTQVNPFINQIMVSKALALLSIASTDRVIDWFCGLGNFTLPIATKAREVVGIEGSHSMVELAQMNSHFNRQTLEKEGGTLGNVYFKAQNLFEITQSDLLHLGNADKWLIDPPREGAHSLVNALISLLGHSDTQGWQAPSKIVYVSCNPATLARDAGLLVHQANYVCKAAGMLNMFPHTAHVESIALFERE
jgi:23S rRNA (uracil1939-C5)-methyltransferase